MRCRALSLLLCGLFAGVGFATAQQDSARIRLFLDCGPEDCYRDYLVTELSAFDLVRDRFQADVQVLLIRQEVPAGGSRWTVSTLGQKAFAGQHDTTAFTVRIADTEAQIRDGLLRVIRASLLRYVLQSPAMLGTLDVRYTARTATELVSQKDPWRLWIFTPGIDGTVSGETARASVLLYNYLNINRTSPGSKVLGEAWYEYNFNRFTNGGVAVRVPVLHTGAWGYWVKSLGERWSAGGFARIERDGFTNWKRAIRALPVLEYNFHRHAENTRRQARIGYGAGIQDFRYFDTTVFNLLRETRPYHQLYLATVYAQPWGSVNGALVARSYLDDFSRHRITARLALSLRLVEGLRLTVSGSGAYVQDQLSLLKRPPSEEDLLLGATQLPTRVLYETTIGFAYTFGSVNNSIVNVRFAGMEE